MGYSPSEKSCPRNCSAPPGSKARWREKQKALAAAVDEPVDTTVDSTENENNNADKDIDKDIDKEKEDISLPAEAPTKTKRFSPPSVEDVAAYCQERKNDIDADAFVDYYSARAWMLGKTKMKDWKAAVRGWEREDKPVKTKTSAPSAEQKVTREDLERMRRFAEQMNGGEEHVKQD